MNCTNFDRNKYPPLRVACIRLVGPYGPAIGEGFQRLTAWAGPRNLFNASTLVLAAYWDDPQSTPPEQCRADACITVAEDFEITDDGEVQIQTLPGGNYASFLNAIYNMEQYAEIWQQIMTKGLAAVTDSGLQCDMRPWLEIYYNCGDFNPIKKTIVDFAIPTN